ncbi:hypothetical protein [Komagataeibacter europaeus]|uniref:hypothetical protein n=1 Tax=Komagataeibacter europaeus TaxID=33995 RepID=UPI0012DE98F2|nr:hypothetical protein [Komagataeibacter europaeus]
MGIAKANAQGGVNGSISDTNTSGISYNRKGINQVEKEISNSEFVVFIDDFHYMDRNLQLDVAKQIRAAIGKNITVCVASVPHRSDDIVRSNHELRGRTCHIDTNFWSLGELEEIGKKGFDALNIELSDSDIKKLAVEACGSPQLEPDPKVFQH